MCAALEQMKRRRSRTTVKFIIVASCRTCLSFAALLISEFETVQSIFSASLSSLLSMKSAQPGNWSTGRCFELVHPTSSSRQFYSMTLDVPNQNNVRCSNFRAVEISRRNTRRDACSDCVVFCPRRFRTESGDTSRSKSRL